MIEPERPQSLDQWRSAVSGDALPNPDRDPPSIQETVQTAPDNVKSSAATRDRTSAAAWLASTAGFAAAVFVAVWWLSLKEPSHQNEPVDPNTDRIEPDTTKIEPHSLDEIHEPSLLEGGSAILVVETDPDGVEVLIADVPAGRTPLQLRNMRDGVYPVTLRRPDYETIHLEDQQLVEGRVLRVERTMVRATGALTVFTEPPNAWIERDGERLAQGTPVTLEGLSAGTLALTLGADEYRAILVEVDVPKDGVGMLERTLDRIPYGTLTLVLEPDDATVTLPDIAPAYRPGMRLPEGEHHVIVARQGYRQVTEKLEVTGDTRQRIELAIEPQSFMVLTSPVNALVQLVDVENNYLDGILLEPGDYRIRVSAPEYEPLEERVAHGFEPTVHSVELARKPQPFTVTTAPAEAVVSLVGHTEDYVAGIRLPPGEYRIRVSAEGYESREESIRHGTDPTRIEISLDRSVPQPGDTFSDALASGGNGPEMVVIPEGTFQMGCLSYDDDCQDHEMPVHEVRIPQSFALSKYEVTRAEFSRFVKETRHSTGGYCANFEGRSWVKPAGRSWRNHAIEQSDSHPVVCVSWQDAKGYVAWLSRQTGSRYRLPSESEWEFAARAESVTKYHFGNAAAQLCRWGNVAELTLKDRYSGWDVATCRDGHVYTSPVGMFSPNAFGLHDMHGNVWEWVEDCWNDSYYGAPTGGMAWTNGDCAKRVMRGGSWGSYPGRVRSAIRNWRTTSNLNLNLGFRVARTLDH